MEDRAGPRVLPAHAAAVVAEGTVGLDHAMARYVDRQRIRCDGIADRMARRHPLQNGDSSGLGAGVPVFNGAAGVEDEGMTPVISYVPGRQVFVGSLIVSETWTKSPGWRVSEAGDLVEGVTAFGSNAASAGRAEH